MKKQLAFVALVALSVAVAAAGAYAKPERKSATTLKGAGSTFVMPLVSKWKEAYKNANIEYSGIGSGGGINAITNRLVDFGASDAPLTGDQFSAAKGVVQVPWALSATSIPYNLPGVKKFLRLQGPTLAKIYLGKVKYWDDKQIKKVNKGVKLPHTKIVPVFRSDASGTSYNFTDYLTKVSPEFKRKVGKGTQPNFPTGTGAAKSSGVAGVLSRTEGAITYVDMAYSIKNGFKVASIQNKAGEFHAPGLATIRAAASTIKKVRKDNAISIVAPPKTNRRAYPICTFTWVIVATKSKKASDLKQFISWAITKGQAFGPKLDFVPLPKIVLKADQATLKKVHS
ncbi:MAG: phosphate ABC transporter substrate-binding protein PstS [Actinomycetota bacterium]|nr:phosphate ABC transporter substrate-binding protein PstS [Actinomycetota bacterium]